MRGHWIRIRPTVLRRIKPSAALTRRALRAARAVIEACRRESRRLGHVGKPLVVGSLAKRTHLRPEPDIDVFVLFPPTLARAELERVGLAVGRKVLSGPTLKFAEHPYVRGTRLGFTFDVVPAYEVRDASDKMSAVDRSPFHLAYVRAHLTVRQRDEVRFLKQFLKGIGCYGAETATGGFSGYLAELLILRFGGFWECLMALRESRAPVELSLAGTPGPLGGALVFVDPVDPRRNAAAAVSVERLETFLRAARAFTARPSLAFFFPRPVRAEPRERLVRHLSHRGVLGMEVPAPAVREDARLPHLRRFAEKVARFFEGEGFRVVRSAVQRISARRYLCLWEHEPVQLPDRYEHRGPRVADEEHVRRFRRKWESHPDLAEPPRIREDRWVVLVHRRRRSALEVLAPRLLGQLPGLEVPGPARARLRASTAIELAARPTLRLPLTRFLAPRDPWDEG